MLIRFYVCVVALYSLKIDENIYLIPVAVDNN